MRKIIRMKTRLMIMISGLLLCFLISPVSWVSADEVGDLKKQLQELNEKMKGVQQKLEDMEKKTSEKQEEIEEIDDRLSKAELHSATDKVSFGVELRSRADSIHYDDALIAPAQIMNSFFAPMPNGFNGATGQQIQQGMANMAAAGMVPPPEKYSEDNDLIYTNKFRLNMNAKIAQNLSFGGRLSAYKTFGDSTGVKFNQGSLGDVTFDGNTSSLPHGDTIRLERAYFNYTHDFGPVPVNFSLGRRPSTDGPPLEYRDYNLEGGSSLATIVNWQFDGGSLNFGLEDATGIPGASFKLCYGVGFEGDWGNSSSLNSNQPDVDDVHLLGFITSLYDDDTNKLTLEYAHAWDITDGFTGLTVMPFIVSKQDQNGDGQSEYYFEPNTGGYISRMEPSTNIGDWDAASLLFRTNFSELFADIDFFISGSWTHTSPSQLSANPFYEMMGQGLLSSNGELEDHDGYSIYAGAVFPMPFDARLGLEYNWGSQYWFNFTGAEDSLVGSKLAVRGQVFEGYYIQPIVNKNFFITLGGQYYDYEYTGSGNPLGKPVKISEASSFDTFNAVIDKVWLAYMSATLRF